MKKSIKNILLAALGIATFLSCSDEALDPQSVFVDSVIELNDLDTYIENNYTRPYNISVLYKFVDMESDMDYYLSPASYESSVRMTRLIQYLALEPYDEVTGSREFIKTYFPKVLNYVGSPAYNNNGTMIIGTAEGGRKITMYNLNALPSRSLDIQYLLAMYFRTIHHEFAHIFHQTKPYTPSFNQISGTQYVQDLWNTEFPNSSAGLTAALTEGFISQYASKDADEDFVELISFYINLTQAQWNARLSNAGSGRAIIEEKIAIVRDYLDVSWNIDIDELRDTIQNRLANLSSFDQTNIN